MDWLTRLRWIGPSIAAAMRTHAWRAFAHLQTVHWTRLAAAMTFTSFLALFPLLALAAAIAAALLSSDQLHRLENKINQQIPGIADQINVAGLVAHAGAVGLTAGILLLFTGIGWVSSLRDCLRAVWGLDDEGRNVVQAKLADGGVLFGLGIAILVSLGATGFASAAVNATVAHVGIEKNGPVPALLTAVGFLFAVLADFLILCYLLTLLPSVRPPRRNVVVAGLIGAVGFEALKLLISGYLQRVAGRSIYGAFGTPVALLLWINFMAKLLVYCAAWTATPRQAPPAEEPEPAAPQSPEAPEGPRAPEAPAAPEEPAAPEGPAAPEAPGSPTGPDGGDGPGATSPGGGSGPAPGPGADANRPAPGPPPGNPPGTATRRRPPAAGAAGV